MSTGIYGNVSGAARKASKLYGNVSGTNRKLKTVWADVGGVARKIYNSAGPATWTYTSHASTFHDARFENGGVTDKYSAYLEGSAEGKSIYDPSSAEIEVVYVFAEPLWIDNIQVDFSHIFDCTGSLYISLDKQELCDLYDFDGDHTNYYNVKKDVTSIDITLHANVYRTIDFSRTRVKLIINDTFLLNNSGSSLSSSSKI